MPSDPSRGASLDHRADCFKALMRPNCIIHDALAQDHPCSTAAVQQETSPEDKTNNRQHFDWHLPSHEGLSRAFVLARRLRI